MTWGSHCPMCGSEDCSWVNTPACEGRYKALEAENAELRKVGDAFAWLVELGPSCVQTPHYLIVDLDTELTWTTDANLALRFSREKDAKAMIKHHGWTEATAIEHAWPLPKAQRQGGK